MSENNTPSNLVYFITGAALGAAIALLLAPQSGEETRTQIRRRTQDGRDTLEKRGRDAYEKGRDLYQKGRDLAEEAAQAFEEKKAAFKSRRGAASEGADEDDDIVAHA